MPGAPRVRVGLFVFSGLALLRVAVAMGSTAGVLLIVAITLGVLFWTVFGSLSK